MIPTGARGVGSPVHSLPSHQQTNPYQQRQPQHHYPVPHQQQQQQQQQQPPRHQTAQPQPQDNAGHPSPPQPHSQRSPVVIDMNQLNQMVDNELLPYFIHPTSGGRGSFGYTRIYRKSAISTSRQQSIRVPEYNTMTKQMLIRHLPILDSSPSQFLCVKIIPKAKIGAKTKEQATIVKVIDREVHISALLQMSDLSELEPEERIVHRACLVRLYSYFNCLDYAILCMDYVPNIPFNSFYMTKISRKDSPPQFSLLPTFCIEAVLLQLLLTIKVLNQLDISHRDIKPDNTLLIQGTDVFTKIGGPFFPKRWNVNTTLDEFERDQTHPDVISALQHAAEYIQQQQQLQQQQQNNDDENTTQQNDNNNQITSTSEHFVPILFDLPIIKMIDFGFARLHPSEQNDLTMSCPGTALFQSPTLLGLVMNGDQHEQVSMRNADLYAIGLTIFTLLFGYIPHSHSSSRRQLAVYRSEATFTSLWAEYRTMYQHKPWLHQFPQRVVTPELQNVLEQLIGPQPLGVYASKWFQRHRETIMARLERFEHCQKELYFPQHQAATPAAVAAAAAAAATPITAVPSTNHAAPRPSETTPAVVPESLPPPLVGSDKPNQVTPESAQTTTSPVDGFEVNATVQTETKSVPSAVGPTVAHDKQTPAAPPPTTTAVPTTATTPTDNNPESTEPSVIPDHNDSNAVITSVVGPILPPSLHQNTTLNPSSAQTLRAQIERDQIDPHAVLKNYAQCDGYRQSVNAALALGTIAQTLFHKIIWYSRQGEDPIAWIMDGGSQQVPALQPVYVKILTEERWNKCFIGGQSTTTTATTTKSSSDSTTTTPTPTKTMFFHYERLFFYDSQQQQQQSISTYTPISKRHMNVISLHDHLEHYDMFLKRSHSRLLNLFVVSSTAIILLYHHLVLIHRLLPEYFNMAFRYYKKTSRRLHKEYVASRQTHSKKDILTDYETELQETAVIYRKISLEAQRIIGLLHESAQRIEQRLACLSFQYSTAVESFSIAFEHFFIDWILQRTGVVPHFTPLDTENVYNGTTSIDNVSNNVTNQSSLPNPPTSTSTTSPPSSDQAQKLLVSDTYIAFRGHLHRIVKSIQHVSENFNDNSQQTSVLIDNYQLLRTPSFDIIQSSSLHHNNSASAFQSQTSRKSSASSEAQQPPATTTYPPIRPSSNPKQPHSIWFTQAAISTPQTTNGGATSVGEDPFEELFGLKMVISEPKTSSSSSSSSKTRHHATKTQDKDSGDVTPAAPAATVIPAGTVLFSQNITVEQSTESLLSDIYQKTHDTLQHCFSSFHVPVNCDDSNTFLRYFVSPVSQLCLPSQRQSFLLLSQHIYPIPYFADSNAGKFSALPNFYWCSFPANISLTTFCGRLQSATSSVALTSGLNRIREILRIVPREQCSQQVLQRLEEWHEFCDIGHFFNLAPGAVTTIFGTSDMDQEDHNNNNNKEKDKALLVPPPASTTPATDGNVPTIPSGTKTSPSSPQ